MLITQENAMRLLLPGLLALAVLTISYSAVGDTWQDQLIIEPPTATDAHRAELTDVECLALTIYFEARGESAIGQAVVAQLVVNRMAHPAYQDTACGVIKQRRQFEWIDDGKSDAPDDKTAYTDAYVLAVRYLYLGETAPVPYADQILNVHATIDRYGNPFDPGWHNLKRVAVIGQQVFYRR